MLKSMLLSAGLVTLALPVAAQDMAKARRVIAPMMQETAPGAGGEVLTDCVLKNASSSEASAMAAASGPSRELGALITSILSREATIACFQAAAK